MSAEDRLRAAVEARTDAVWPAPDGWERIQSRLGRRVPVWRRPFLLAPVAAALLAGVVLAAVLLTSDEEEPDRSIFAGQPPTTVATTSTTLAPPTADEEVSRAIWPTPGTSRSFDDPRALVLSFAKEFLGMENPAVGELREGGPDDGEIELRPRADSPLVTTVLVARADVPDAWIVTGAVAANLQLESPEPLTEVTSPLTISGRSRTYEATVNVAVLEDGQVLREGPALHKGFFTGGGGGVDLEPFDTSVEFDAPSERAGALVLSTMSAEDGGLDQATVVRVVFD
jgi:hypothetical protein